MERINVRLAFAKACFELAIIALGAWVTIMYVDLPHWGLLILCGVALVAGVIVWPKTSRKNDEASGVEEKDKSQEGVWRSLWQDFWYDMLPYWTREFLGAFLMILSVSLLLLLFSAWGKFVTWFEAL